MNQATVADATPRTTRLEGHTCSACGMPAPAMLAVLPSGRRVLVEACAICGRQEATPMDAAADTRMQPATNINVGKECVSCGNTAPFPFPLHNILLAADCDSSPKHKRGTEGIASLTLRDTMLGPEMRRIRLRAA